MANFWADCWMTNYLNFGTWNFFTVFLTIFLDNNFDSLDLQTYETLKKHFLSNCFNSTSLDIKVVLTLFFITSLILLWHFTLRYEQWKLNIVGFMISWLDLIMTLQNQMTCKLQWGVGRYISDMYYWCLIALVTFFTPHTRHEW